jgi:transaldolase
MSGSDRAELARHALEQICSGSDPSAAVGVYSPDFHDHVNAREYHGHDGITQSLGLYQLVFSDGDLRIRVEDQVGESERVASRWVAEGHNRYTSCARSRSTTPGARGMSTITQRPDAAVSAATTAIAPL